jgi:hypothetical protein
MRQRKGKRLCCRLTPKLQLLLEGRDRPARLQCANVLRVPEQTGYAISYQEAGVMWKNNTPSGVLQARDLTCRQGKTVGWVDCGVFKAQSRHPAVLS